MTCSYCSKPMPLVFVLQEDVPGVGPSIRHACFPCLTTIGERVMTEYRKAQQAEVAPPPDLTSGATECVPCTGCGGMRRESCKDYGRHHHDWCDCQ
jgi:hypothetical protein